MAAISEVPNKAPLLHMLKYTGLESATKNFEAKKEGFTFINPFPVKRSCHMA